MRPHIWPGLALSGGVVIAAIVVLLALGGGGGSGHGSLPPGAGPGSTRLYPPGPLAARTGSGSVGHGATHDAAASQYHAQATRGAVLGGP